MIGYILNECGNSTIIVEDKVLIIQEVTDNFSKFTVQLSKGEFEKLRDMCSIRCIQLQDDTKILTINEPHVTTMPGVLKVCIYYQTKHATLHNLP